MKTIDQLHRYDKPREKLAARGAQALKNDELMAVLLGSGVRGKDVRKLLREIVALMDRHFDASDAALTLDTLCAVSTAWVPPRPRRFSPHSSSPATISPAPTAALPVRRMCTTSSNRSAPKPRSTSSSSPSMVPPISSIPARSLSVRSTAPSSTPPREVFADAIADRAAGIIITHNHPSGVLDASHADRQITQRLKEVSNLVGIELLDHVILARDGYVSFSDEGWL